MTRGRAARALRWSPESVPATRLLLGVGDAHLERALAAAGLRPVGVVRDAAELRRHARTEVAEGVVLSVHLPGVDTACVAALPAGWTLLLLAGLPGPRAAALAAAAMRRPRARVLAGPWLHPASVRRAAAAAAGEP